MADGICIVNLYPVVKSFVVNQSLIIKYKLHYRTKPQLEIEVYLTKDFAVSEFGTKAERGSWEAASE